jgi:hypothetical protein
VRTPKPAQRRLVLRYLKHWLRPKRRKGRPKPKPPTFPDYFSKLKTAWGALPAVHQQILRRHVVDGDTLAYIALFSDRSARWVRQQKRDAVEALCHALWTTLGVPRRLAYSRRRIYPDPVEHHRTLCRERYRAKVAALGRPLRVYRPREGRPAVP